MFELKRSGPAKDQFRLLSSEVLTADDFARIARESGQQPRRARKTGLIAARLSGKTQVVETLWNGKETENTAGAEDWIVTNLTADGTALRDDAGNTNTYVIAADRFGELYESGGGSNAFGDIYRPKATVETLRLAGGFEIMAPWGETMRTASGYLLLNGPDVYGVAEAVFQQTYQFIE